MGAGASTRPYPTETGRLLLASPAPCGGRWAARRPGTPCAAAAAPQRRAHHAGPCAAALSGGAAVCCCVTPHTGPARWHHLKVKGPHRAGAPGCIPGSSSVHSGLLPAGWPSSGQPPHHSAAALCRSFLGGILPQGKVRHRLRSPHGAPHKAGTNRQAAAHRAGAPAVLAPCGG